MADIKCFKASDGFKYEQVALPSQGEDATIRVKTLSIIEYMQRAEMFTALSEDESLSVSEKNLRSMLVNVCFAMVDPDGKRLVEPDDYEVLNDALTPAELFEINTVVGKLENNTTLQAKKK